MVEVVGLAENEEHPDCAAAWEASVALLQVMMRGIDMICLFKPYTVCIFLPGLSQDAALERAEKLFNAFGEAREDWEFGITPKRLKISSAFVTRSESTAEFLNRVEQGLEYAADTSEMEVVVHSEGAYQTHSV
jgi:PleD family two-component response regulator